MISRNYKGYLEGRDLTQIPMDCFAYPSKNFIVYKGVAFTRPGLLNDGTEPTGDFKINGEFVWKDSLGGEKALKSTIDGRLQYKYNGKWITIYTGLTSGALRVRFATWIDSNGAIIKKRLYFVDGSENIYEWNGAVAEIATVNAAGHEITISGTRTPEQISFDPSNVAKSGTISSTGGAIVGVGTKFTTELTIGQTIVSESQSKVITAITDDTHMTTTAFSPDVVAKPFTLELGVKIVRFSGGNVAGVDDLVTDSDMSSTTIHFTSAFANTPVAGDLVIGAVTKHTAILAGTGIVKDDIYCFQNKVVLGSLTSIRQYYSDTVEALQFTVPAEADRVATSPFFVDLAGNYTAMISRFNQNTQETILWVSDVDGWTKVRALVDQDSFGNWVDTDRIAQTERIGALPFMVADYKGDIIFMAQDRTLQRVMTLDVLSRDELKLISEDIEGLLNRVDVEEGRIYYGSRYIQICFPAEGMFVMLDMVDGKFMPPQTIGIGHISVIDGVQYGHSNTRDETFYLFRGYNDLGSRIQTIFAMGYFDGEGKDNPFRPKQHTMMGVSGRMTQTSIATVQEFYESDGAKAKETFKIDGSKVKLYSVSEDFSWATHIWGGASWGGADMNASVLKRVYAFDKYSAVSWFEWRAIITVDGPEQQFHLLGFFIDEDGANRKIPEDLFIPKPTP